MTSFAYQSEKFATARSYLMLPHPNGEASSIKDAFRECTLGLAGVDRQSLDDDALAWVNELEDLMNIDGLEDPGGKRGHYDLFAAVPAYLDHLRANKGSDVNARLKLAQVQKIQLYVEQMENELVKTSDAAAVFRAASTAWRNEASKLPQRVARRIAKSKDPSEIREILRDELDQVFYRFEKAINRLVRNVAN